jgi:hypothetical protein
MGSVVSGIPQSKGVDYETIENETVSSAVDEVRQRATNWVMNEMRSELVKRHSEEVLK